MKYLKHFESNTFEFSDIKDILLELEDSRIYGSIETTPSRTYGGKSKTYIGFYLKDFSDYDGFHFNEISDCVFRLKDYLGDNIKSCSILLVEDKEKHFMGVFSKSPTEYSQVSDSRKEIELNDESKLITLLGGKSIENLIIQLK
jgi:hypothetical protein